MPSINFQPRFAELIKAGTKIHTVRKARTDKGAPKPGSTLYLFTGLRTKYTQRIMQVKCLYVAPISIRVVGDGEMQVTLDGRMLTHRALNYFVVADGFANVPEMAAWISKQYGGALDDAVLIGWRPVVYETVKLPATENAELF